MRLRSGGGDGLRHDPRQSRYWTTRRVRGYPRAARDEPPPRASRRQASLDRRGSQDHGAGVHRESDEEARGARRHAGVRSSQRQEGVRQSPLESAANRDGWRASAGGPERLRARDDPEGDRVRLTTEFFATARERYEILLRRRTGEGLPWTKDPIFPHWRFCNVFREDDRTTIWFRENVRDKIRDDPEAVTRATIAFRWFNRVETGELIKHLLLGEWSSAEAREILRDVRPLVTGAYIIKGQDGMTKLEGVLACVDEAFRMLPPMMSHLTSLEAAHAELTSIPYLGPFMAYEVVTDLRHTSVLEKSPDIMTWANPGPGCTRGLSRAAHGELGHFSRGSVWSRREMLSLMSELLAMSRDSANWPSEWPSWEMREVEHWLCEFDKYERARGGEALKRRYP